MNRIGLAAVRSVMELEKLKKEALAYGSDLSPFAAYIDAIEARVAELERASLEMAAKIVDDDRVFKDRIAKLERENAELREKVGIAENYITNLRNDLAAHGDEGEGLRRIVEQNRRVLGLRPQGIIPIPDGGKMEGE